MNLRVGLGILNILPGYVYVYIYIYKHMWVRLVGLLLSVPLLVPRSQLPPRLLWPCYPPPPCLLLLPPSAKPEGGGHYDRGMMEETGQGRIRCHGSLGGSSKSHVPTSRRGGRMGALWSQNRCVKGENPYLMKIKVFEANLIFPTAKKS